MARTQSMTGGLKRLVPEDVIADPIPGPSPTGEDLAFSDVYRQLKELARADDPEVAGGDEFRPKAGWKRSDWPGVRDAAMRCLRERSKDLRVACFLARALAEIHGLEGMRDGLWVVRECLARWWEGLSPSVDRVRDPRSGSKKWDPEPRRQEIDSLIEAYVLRLRTWPPLRETQDESQAKDAVQAADQVLEELARLEAETDEDRFFTGNPRYGDLREALEKYVAPARDLLDELERRRKEAEEEAQRLAEEERRAREEAERRAAEEMERRRRAADEYERLLAQLLGDDTGREGRAATWRSAVHALAWDIRRGDPRRPGGYVLPLQVSRQVYGGRCTASPPEDVRRMAERLAEDGDTEREIDFLLACSLQPWGVGWGDLYYRLHEVVSSREPPGQAVATEIVQEARIVLLDDPGWPERSFEDGSPVAGEAAREWLREIDHEIRTAPDAFHESLADLDEEVIRRADDLAEAGSLVEAVALLQGEVERQASERARFSARLRFVEWLMAHGLPRLAAPLLQEVMATIRRKGLLGWEAPEFLSRAYVARCRLARENESAALIGVDPAQALRELAALDPLAALRLEEGGEHGLGP
ncbi:MAG: hypothetical protein D6729_04435 [Deltaproteobacteria bacterium]|nr:MAG: hypothetical protein D6729_04435 [Deltaproteobacteria bacterium]